MRFDVRLLLTPAAALFYSCAVPVEHKVTAPQIDEAIKWVKTNAGCPQLPPAPENMSIKVVGKHFDMSHTDAAGLQFMRHYGDVRQCQLGQSTIAE